MGITITKAETMRAGSGIVVANGVPPVPPTVQ